MGALVTRFRRHFQVKFNPTVPQSGSCFIGPQGKPSTIQQLETLEKDMSELEKRSEQNQRLQRLLIGRLIFSSACLYIVAAAFLWFWSFPKHWTDWLFAALPLLIFPVLVLLLKRFMSWWFVRRTQRNYAALEELKERKRKILEEVMEKETYKTAKEILERFDSEAKKAKELEQAAMSPAAVGQDLRQRTPSQRGLVAESAPSPLAPSVGPPAQALGRGPPGPPSVGRGSPGGPGTAPGGPPEKGGAPGVLARRPGGGGHVAAATATAAYTNFPPPHLGMHPPGPPLPRPVLPRERGMADRVIEYLVGDGPQNRYALICQQCSSHNGMALREEFEYIAYRCAYCFSLNPARRTRPLAPRLGDSGAVEPHAGPAAITAAIATTAGPEQRGSAAPAQAGAEESDTELTDDEPAAPVAPGNSDAEPSVSEGAASVFASPPGGEPGGEPGAAPHDTEGDGASTAGSVSPESQSDAETAEPESVRDDKPTDESMDIS